MRIQELRERAQSALGGKFRLADFNDAVLSDGSLSLGLLDSKMLRWIEMAR